MLQYILPVACFFLTHLLVISAHQLFGAFFFGSLPLFVFWASMLTLSRAAKGAKKTEKEPQHFSQVNYVGFMYCHGDAGRFCMPRDTILQNQRTENKCVALHGCASLVKSGPCRG